MEFKDQVIKIGKEIKSRVLSYVLVNKGDDDKKYNYAFLNLKDGRTIEVPFYPVTCDLFINNQNKTTNEFFYIISKSRFGFLVSFSFDYQDKKSILYQAAEIEYQKKELTEGEKKMILDYMNTLNELTKSLNYDKEKTQSIDNLNPDQKKAYNIVQYYNEITASLENNPNSNTIPSVETAVNWWLSNMNTSITENELMKFKEELNLRIMMELSKGNEIYLDSEYGPRGILRDVLESLRLDLTSISANAKMVINVTNTILKGNEDLVLYSKEEPSRGM